jgi:hypothetical protein
MAIFPDPCGADLAEAVRLGTDPKTVVPDDYIVVRGGTRPIPSIGNSFSCTVGPTLEAAAAAVPHGRVQVAAVGAIRRLGGSVIWVPEFSPHGTPNEQHVEVTEASASSFSMPQPNPVPKKLRIDAGI